MATQIRNCPVDGCNQPIDRQHLACIRHWRMVPIALRRDIQAQFKAYKGVKSRVIRTVEEIHQAALKLRTAQERAIAAVNEKETKRAIAADACGDVLMF